MSNNKKKSEETFDPDKYFFSEEIIKKEYIIYYKCPICDKRFWSGNNQGIMREDFKYHYNNHKK